MRTRAITTIALIALGAVTLCDRSAWIGRLPVDSAALGSGPPASIDDVELKCCKGRLHVEPQTPGS